MRRTLAVAALALSLGASACTTVPPGYVGIKVNNYGTNRGVSSLPIVTGRVFYNPWSEDIYKFPTFYQNEVWSASANEGKDHDESITFNSVEGTPVNVDIGLSVAFLPEKVPYVFLHYKKEPQEIIDVFVRNEVRNAFTRAASKMHLTDIMGVGRTALIDSVQGDLRRNLEPQGFLFQQIAIVGDLRLNDAIKSSITAVLSAGNKAIEAERLAAARIAAARGDSASAVIGAEGQSRANELLQRTLTDNLIKQQAIAQWNGAMPQYWGGGSLPLLNIK